MFAQALRDRGVEAEATPRRARGVTRKPERTPLRKMRDRHEAGGGPMSRVRRSAYQEAAKAAFQGDISPRDWERNSVERQATIRGLYLAQARLLKASNAAADRVLSDKVAVFVRAMPAPDSQRLSLARELRMRGLRPDVTSLGGLKSESDEAYPQSSRITSSASGLEQNSQSGTLERVRRSRASGARQGSTCQ